MWQPESTIWWNVKSACINLKAEKDSNFPFRMASLSGFCFAFLSCLLTFARLHCDIIFTGKYLLEKLDCTRISLFYCRHKQSNQFYWIPCLWFFLLRFAKGEFASCWQSTFMLQSCLVWLFHTIRWNLLDNFVISHIRFDTSTSIFVDFLLIKNDNVAGEFLIFFQFCIFLQFCLRKIFRLAVIYFQFDTCWTQTLQDVFIFHPIIPVFKQVLAKPTFRLFAD